VVEVPYVVNDAPSLSGYLAPTSARD
jgi:hypothetical protein